MLRSPLLLLSLMTLAVGAAAQNPPAVALSTTVAGGAPTTAPVPAPVVYHAADEMPSFPGGEAAFAKFLRAKINYPAEALNHGASGKVHVSFVVDETGRILDAKVVKGLGFGLDEEALRLVRIMPWWKPGRIGGQPVRVAYTMPIVFRALE
ncbi:energy transducer TonB [Hymenobacter persicinus]|uniref:Energy transducer TonB n=1 Tax=Hymenobacter persicinus TaxID=2025506 RepID=A0A4Q5LBV0_9BACT|nr:energy transducer TonB [Hymenobacter persicinus]RYU79571.1 energy transducer TonB [Hymenobacter persicinus]